MAREQQPSTLLQRERERDLAKGLVQAVTKSKKQQLEGTKTSKHVSIIECVTVRILYNI